MSASASTATISQQDDQDVEDFGPQPITKLEVN